MHLSINIVFSLLFVTVFTVPANGYKDGDNFDREPRKKCETKNHEDNMDLKRWNEFKRSLKEIGDNAESAMNDNDYQEASNLFNKTLELRNYLFLGDEDADTLNIINKLAKSLSMLDRCEEAVKYYTKLANSKTEQLELADINQETLMFDFAEAWYCAGNYEKALIRYEDLENIISTDDVENILQIKQGKAASLNHLGRHTEALAVYDGMLIDTLASFGNESSEYLALEHEIALTILQVKPFDEAVAKLELVLQHQQNVLGKMHDSTLQTLSELGLAYEREGRQNETLALYEANNVTLD